MDSTDDDMQNRSLAKTTENTKQPWESAWQETSRSILRILGGNPSPSEKYDSQMLQLHKLSVLALATSSNKQELVDKFDVESASLPTESDSAEVARRIADAKASVEALARLREENVLTQEGRLLKQLEQAGRKIGWIQNDPEEDLTPRRDDAPERKIFFIFLAPCKLASTIKSTA
ncbi:MAG: hypothetical protein V4568_00190 [Pseudomonadota bacterium]